MAELDDAVKLIDAAGDYTDLFPKEGTVRDVYLKLVGVVHPDRYLGKGNGEYTAATKAFQRLQQLYSDAKQALDEKRYGEPVVTMRSNGYTHAVKRRCRSGDIAELFEITTDGVGGNLLKVARSARDNDLIATEAAALKKLHSVDDQFTRAYPKLMDTFIYRSGRRRANVIERYQDCYTVAELRERYPGGMDPRHVVWIWRRLLMGLGFAHNHGLLHGAVVPPHILVLPEPHGVILLDWCYSATMTVSDRKAKTPPVLKTKAAHHLGWADDEDDTKTSPIKAIVDTYTDWYPTEVINKQPPTPATDIALAARSMIHLLGGQPVTGAFPERVPRQLRAFFRGCIYESQTMRPDNAWNLLEEFDQLLKRIGEPYHPRRFVKLVVPSA